MKRLTCHLETPEEKARMNAFLFTPLKCKLEVYEANGSVAPTAPQLFGTLNLD